jgi:hypothetical protein
VDGLNLPPGILFQWFTDTDQNINTVTVTNHGIDTLGRSAPEGRNMQSVQLVLLNKGSELQRSFHARLNNG